VKLSEALHEPIRTVAYAPDLRALTGSTTATLLLCQLIYWTKKQRDAEGWIQKRVELAQDDPDGRLDPSNQSLQFETGLSYWELIQARRVLRRLGFLKERLQRAEHKLYFKVDFEALERAWSAQGHGRAAEPPEAPSQTEDDEATNRDGHPDEPRMAPWQTEDDNATNRVSLIGASTEYSKTTKDQAHSVTKIAIPLTWSILHGLPVSEEQLERERAGAEATSAFESALGVREWPWASNRVWEKMVALAAEAWKQDPDVFREYSEWMEREGKYKAMSLKQIRANPQQFIDTGWPLFLATRKPREPEPVQGESDMARRVREWEVANGKGREPPT
jgi:hypothetical protein